MRVWDGLTGARIEFDGSEKMGMFACDFRVGAGTKVVRWYIEPKSKLIRWLYLLAPIMEGS